MEFFSEAIRRDPYPFYARLRQQSALVSDPQEQVWFVLDYDSVKRVLTETETFSSNVAPAGGKTLDWIVFADPPRHTRLRNIFTRAFMPRSAGAYEPRIRAVSRQLLNRQLERGEMDLVDDYASPLPSLVIADVIGIPAQDQATFVSWNDLLQNLSTAVLAQRVTPRQRSQYTLIQERMSLYLQTQLSQRRRLPQDDLLTRLTQAEVDGEKLSEPEIMGFLQLLFSAATETSTNLIANAILTLMEYPEAYAELRNHPELIPAAVEELLRFRSPIQTLIRQTQRPAELHGRTLPAGRYVFALLGAANRDPKVFAEPDRFDLHREAHPHLAFGYGAHYCMGLQLGKLEARIALEDLLILNHLRLKQSDWKPQAAQHVLGPAHLPIRFQARSLLPPL